MSSDYLISRRGMVTSFGAGMAGAALTAAVPATATQTSNGATVAPFVDPTTKYPKPPYPAQSQPWPGLASKMNPRPDHGETSYKGSGRLMGRKALITGGDSGMGRAAAIAYAREGADVVISYYPTEEPDAREVIQLIESAGRKAIPIPGDLREEKYCENWWRKLSRDWAASTLSYAMLDANNNVRTSSHLQRKPLTRP
jgi:hypothetical protein